MRLPLQISFHHTPRSDEIEDLINERAALLDEFAGDIMSCRVVVDMPHRHHEHGNQYQVRIDVKLPDKEIASTREPGERTAYKDIHVAVRDAFDSVVRQLEDYARLRRGAVKVRAATPHAKVLKLFPVDGYGFLRTPEGREIYFSAGSVLDGEFARLAVGTEVSFSEEEGEKGPQASSVAVVGRHGRL